MSVITVIKKIGEKVISIVEWPIKHSVMLGEMLVDALKDGPKTKAALVGLAQQFEALGPDAVAAIAADGFNIPDDVKVATDLKSLFAFWQATVLPAIEQDYADFKTAESVGANPVSTVPAPAAEPAAQTAPQSGPGLHAVSAA